jgi:membrane fusion protein (multidrug efflux system)
MYASIPFDPLSVERFGTFSLSGMELKMAAPRHYKNKFRSSLVIHSKFVLALVMGVALGACGKSDQTANQPQAGMALPVSVIEVQPTSVPISAEAVAQTEGAKAAT